MSAGLMALAGGLQGLGTGLVEDAKQKRETMLMLMEREWRSQEADKDRDFRSKEAETDRSFRSREAQTDREWRREDAQIDRGWRVEDREDTQDFQSGEASTERGWRSGEAEADRGFRRSEREGTQEFQTGRDKTQRGWQVEDREDTQGFQSGEAQASRDFQEDQARTDRIYRSGEAERQRGWQSEEAEAERGWKDRQPGDTFVDADGNVVRQNGLGEVSRPRDPEGRPLPAQRSTGKLSDNNKRVLLTDASRQFKDMRDAAKDELNLGDEPKAPPYGASDVLAAAAELQAQYPDLNDTDLAAWINKELRLIGMPQDEINAVLAEADMPTVVKGKPTPAKPAETAKDKPPAAYPDAKWSDKYGAWFVQRDGQWLRID